jgi:hypothetical protein
MCPAVGQQTSSHLSLSPLFCVRVSVTLPRTTREMLNVRSRSSLMMVGAPMITWTHDSNSRTTACRRSCRQLWEAACSKFLRVAINAHVAAMMDKLSHKSTLGTQL